MRRTSQIIPPEVLLEAYSRGIFPMASPLTGRVEWYQADPRGIIDLERFHIPCRLRRSLRQNPFEIRIDSSFDEVIAACADRDDTWISRAIRNSYQGLHRAGYAHSVESWRDGSLQGGLYGVAIQGAFFGESMFHRTDNASKAALIALSGHLRSRGFQLLDTQMVTPLTAQFGAELISAAEYQIRLKKALHSDCQF